MVSLQCYTQFLSTNIDLSRPLVNPTGGSYHLIGQLMLFAWWNTVSSTLVGKTQTKKKNKIWEHFCLGSFDCWMYGTFSNEKEKTNPTNLSQMSLVNLERPWKRENDLECELTSWRLGCSSCNSKKQTCMFLQYFSTWHCEFTVVIMIKTTILQHSGICSVHCKFLVSK